ncbi:MAG: hypothetical protein INR65_13045, partial [Gluconacetobacter diazotrophicus]|nr:hypothetical protein [Gluconacetobacter diazotrophicus]
VVADRPRKSLGAEHTFNADITDLAAAVAALRPALDKVWDGYRRGGRGARTVTLKVKYADFRIVTRAASGPRILETRDSFEAATLSLLAALHPFRLPVRLLGVSVSRYDDETVPDRTPDLFATHRPEDPHGSVSSTPTFRSLTTE